MLEKVILCPDRVRKISGSFSFIEHRFLREGFFHTLTHHELLLYLFLVLASDREGLSFYGYDRICTLIKITVEEFILARDGLMDKDLVFHAPTQTLYAQWVDKLLPARNRHKSVVIQLSVEDRWIPDRFVSIVKDLEQIRTTTEAGHRVHRIEQYYSHKRSINPADKPSSPPRPVYRFGPGERVLHGVFGQGTVNQESEHYLFVKFDDDEIVRKFDPGDTWEFTRLSKEKLSQ